MRDAVAATLESTRAIARELAQTEEIYATVVSGDCMAPEIPSGNAVAVDPHATIRPGDLIIIVRRPEFVREGDVPAVLKRLEGRLRRDRALRVSMLNPACCITIPGSEVAAVHRCLGLVETTADGQHAHVPHAWFNSPRRRAATATTAKVAA